MKVLMLDFDGVILESNDIKDRAFEYTFADYPEYLPAIMQYHFSNNGIIRFKKFEHIVEHILGRTYTPKDEAFLAGRFSQFVLRRTAECPLVEGAGAFLDFFYTKVPLYLVSVNPPKDLEHTLKVRKLDHYFKGVYATGDKVTAIREILKLEKIGAQQALFVGDSYEDLLAAKAVNVPFIGRDSGKSFRDESVVLCANLVELKVILDQIKD